MNTNFSRREFVSAAAGSLCAFSLIPYELLAEPGEQVKAAGLDFPLLDLHVHLDNSTIDKVLEISEQRGAKFGIVEHAGTKENIYPVVLSNDAELKRYLAMLEGKPVYKGIQAEWTDWMCCFSLEALAQLDYVLTDTMTFSGKDRQRVKLWEKGADQKVEMRDRQAFMDRYVDWHVEIMAREPVDILANVSWLPPALAADYDAFWTPARIEKVIAAAVKHQVALEISASYRLPRLPFLKVAKAGGVKFTFGSNGRYPNMGKLDYSIQMAKELGLKPSDMFTPAHGGQKAVLRRAGKSGAKTLDSGYSSVHAPCDSLQSRT
jgi:histidinol phosphatase-like PHP family hydrolase